MRKDKIRAYELRRKNKSYSEIARSLGVPKSTLAEWFKNEDWSKEIRDDLRKKHSLSNPKRLAAAIKAHKERWSRKYSQYRADADREFVSLKNNALFMPGMMLYWGEGEKSPRYSRIKFANSDPLMIKLFYKFLKKTLKVKEEKITVYLLLYPDLKDEMQKSFWNKATGIPLSAFRKSIYIKGRHPTKRLSYGVCNVVVNNRELKEKFIRWIELCVNHLE